MIDLTIGSKTYRHPSKLEEVTLDQWIKLKAVQPEEDGYDNLRGFSAFADIPLGVLKKAPKKDMAFYILQLTELLSDANMDERTPLTKFKIGKYRYNVEQSLDDASVGQYIDCTHYMKILPEEEYLPYMMAIYCLRNNESYDDIDLQERVKEMRRAKVMVGLNVNAFFLNSSKDYLRDFQLYSEENQQESKSKQVAKS